MKQPAAVLVIKGGSRKDKLALIEALNLDWRDR
jgi:hypothetical protein